MVLVEIIVLRRLFLDISFTFLKKKKKKQIEKTDSRFYYIIFFFIKSIYLMTNKYDLKLSEIIFIRTNCVFFMLVSHERFSLHCSNENTVRSHTRHRSHKAYAFKQF